MESIRKIHKASRAFALLCVLYWLPIQVITAEELRIDVHIPAQKLSEALIDFSALYNRVVVGLPDTLKGHYSHEVKGLHTAEDALATLLKGTGLDIETGEFNGFVIIAPPPSVEATKILEQQAAQKIRKEKDARYEEVFIFGRPNDARPRASSTSGTFLDQSFIEKHQLDSLELISNRVPNANTGAFEEYNADINIRGVNNSAGSVNQSTTPVAFHYNNIYRLPIEINALSYFDLGSAVVLKGAQNTERGRASIAGSYYINGASATTEESLAKLDITVGNYDREKFEAMFNLPITESWAVRVAGIYDYHAGQVENWTDYRHVNNALGEPVFRYPSYDTPAGDHQNRSSTFTEFEQYNNRNKYAWRANSFWRISDTITWDLSYDSHHDRGTGAVFIDPLLMNNFGWGGVFDRPGVIDAHNQFVSSRLAFKLEDIHIDYLFGWSDFEFYSEADVDHGREESEVVAWVPNRSVKSDTHTIELYNTEKARGLNWLLGSYLEHNSSQIFGILDVLKEDNDNNIESQFSSIIDTPFNAHRTLDLYGKLEYGISDQTKLFTGARYQDVDSDLRNHRVALCNINGILDRGANTGGKIPDNVFISQNILDGERILGNDIGARSDQNCYINSQFGDRESWHKFTYDAGINYSHNNHLNSILKFSTGYRPGNIQGAENVDEHTSESIELQLSGTLFSSQLFYSMVFFHTEHKDLHSFGNRYADINNDDVFDEYLFTDTQNEADASTQGIELTLTYENGWGGLLDIRASYLKAELDRYAAPDGLFFGMDTPWASRSNDPDLRALEYLDLSGNKLIHAPEYTLALSYDQSFLTAFGEFTPKADIFWSDEYFLDWYNRDSITATRDDGETYEFNNLSKQDSYATLDLSILWKFNNLSLRAFARNVTDENIRLRAHEGFYSEEGLASSYAAPRTYGVSLSLKIR